MLKPLDSEKLAALLGPRKDARCGQTSAAILLLGEMGDLRNGVYSLLETHPATFEARARFEDDNLDIWSIRFRVRNCHRACRLEQAHFLNTATGLPFPQPPPRAHLGNCHRSICLRGKPLLFRDARVPS